MHVADKAVLRLGVGMAVAVLLAYGMALKSAFVVCMLAVVLLCSPGPPMPLAKGVVAGCVVAALLAAGLLMVPLLEHYRIGALLLTAVVLYAVFFAGARKRSPMTMILVMAFTMVPVAGFAQQALALALAQAIGLGLAVAVLVSGISHALFPDPPAARTTRTPPTASVAAARWSALQATLVMMPVFVVALTNPALYMAAIMKTATLGQQSGGTDAHSAGRELVGSTAMGAWLAMLVWGGLTLRPNLWMLMLWLTAAALWVGVRLFRVKASRAAPSFWLNALITMLILLGLGIDDAAVGKDVYAASALRVTLFIAVALYAWATLWALERWRPRAAPLTSSSSSEPVPP